MPRWVVLAVLLGATACAKPVPPSLAKAMVGAAVTTAAVMTHRAITGCYVTCSGGRVCDEESGKCVAAECAPHDPDCGNTPDYAAAIEVPAPEAEPDETCGGYCRNDERCVIRHDGDLRCVLRGPARRAVPTAF